MTCEQTQTPEIDLPAFREKYRREAKKRHRPEGFAQYLEARGEMEEYFEFDPYSPPAPRASVADEIDVEEKLHGGRRRRSSCLRLYRTPGFSAMAFELRRRVEPGFPC